LLDAASERVAAVVSVCAHVACWTCVVSVEYWPCDALTVCCVDCLCSYR
jgi:hypothetical protein